jgi:hypothetical protein
MGKETDACPYRWWWTLSHILLLFLFADSEGTVEHRIDAATRYASVLLSV